MTDSADKVTKYRIPTKDRAAALAESQADRKDAWINAFKGPRKSKVSIIKVGEATGYVGGKLVKMPGDALLDGAQTLNLFNRLDRIQRRPGGIESDWAAVGKGLAQSLKAQSGRKQGA